MAEKQANYNGYGAGEKMAEDATAQMGQMQLGDSGREQEAAQVEPAIELEHAIGFNGTIPSGLKYHPNGTDFVYPAGGCLVVCDFNDPHNQVFLRGHDDNLSAVALSRSGKLAATGQTGLNADVVVWAYGDAEQKSAMYRLSEHDHGVACLAFSQDERLLVTIGVKDDGKMFVWDMTTGNIVGTAKAPPDTRCVAFGGMYKNVKRRPTGSYQFVTAGNQSLVFWTLEPMSGTLNQVKIPSRVQRNYTCLSWSDDYELLVLGTESGDFCFCAFVDKRSLTLCDSVTATSGGVHAVHCDGNMGDDTARVFVGGGDGSLGIFQRDRNTFIETASTKLGGCITSVSLSADGTESIVGTSNGLAYRVTTNGLRSLMLCETHADAVTAVAYAPNLSERFITASSDGTLRVWDASDYTVIIRASVVDGGRPTCVALSVDAIISGWEDGKVRCHLAETGEWLWEIPNAHAGKYMANV